MKPASFVYHAPTSVAEATSLLGDDVKVLAGGQSLVPAMNFRLARPAALVDINGIGGLDQIDVTESTVVVGATVRHRLLERQVEDGPLGRLLSGAARHIGHLPIRVRGTLAGSVAHADPAAEWCTIVRALDARIVAVSTAGTRVITADDFFHTVFTTDLHVDEMIERVEFPRLSSAHLVGFAEFSRRAGDFALVMAAAVVEMDGDVVRAARIAVGGASDVPVRLSECEDAMVGLPLTDETIGSIADLASRSITPLEDIHASVAYRRDLIRAMTRRALSGAA